MQLFEHYLIAEARRKTELYEREAEVERRLGRAREGRRGGWRLQAARWLLALADRLSAGQRPSAEQLNQTSIHTR